MRLFNNILKRAGVANIFRIEAKLNFLIGKRSTKFIFRVVICAALKCPLSLSRFLPVSITAIFANITMNFSSDYDRYIGWLENTKKSKDFNKFFILGQLDAKRKYFGLNEAFSTLMELNNLEDRETQTYLKQWALFNLTNSQNVKFFTTFMKKNVNLSNVKNYNENLIRYLPDHTRHMGHLGMLYLYGKFYGAVDKDRTIGIWPGQAANNYYLSQLLEQFPLKVKLLDNNINLNYIESKSIDTIFYSMVNEKKWRFEPLMLRGTGQIFPELMIKPGETLGCNPNITEFALSKLKQIGFNPNKWFVILHIKEESVGYKNFGEARDADINSYSEACKLIQDFGGQVIRMGASNFPKLNKSFPAINYANSNVKSDKIDYWLWANCQLWVGNGNGAAAAVIPFGKKRVITNAWPYEANGPSEDIVIPKLIKNKLTSKVLDFSQVIKSDISGTFNKHKIINLGYEILENPAEVIRESIKEALTNASVNRKVSKLEQDFYESLNTPETTPRMRLSKVFEKYFYEEAN